MTGQLFALADVMPRCRTARVVVIGRKRTAGTGPPEQDRRRSLETQEEVTGNTGPQELALPCFFKIW